MGLYHSETRRAPWWRYTRRGVYLVRMELRHPRKGFRQQNSLAFQLTHLGIVADLVWQSLRARHKSVEWREYAIGKSSLYGIVAIVDDLAPRITPPVTINPNHVPSVLEEYGVRRTPEPTDWFMSHISPDHRSLGAMVRTYKSEVTKHSKRLGLEMQWRPRYSDRLLRDEQSYDAALAFLKDVERGKAGDWVKGGVWGKRG